MFELIGEFISFANKTGVVGILCLCLLVFLVYLYKNILELKEENKQLRLQVNQLMEQRYQDLVNFKDEISEIEKEINLRAETRERELIVSMREEFERGYSQGKQNQEQRGNVRK